MAAIMTTGAGSADAFGIAFPGQGTKSEAMIAALHRHRDHPLVRAFHDGVGGREPEELDFTDTAVAQPATYALGIAAAEAAFGHLVDVPLALGHSLGELTAAACAGVIDVRAGLHLATRRGELCREHARQCPGAMVAIMGAELDHIEWVRRRALADAGGVLEIAGVNGRQQVVLSGDRPTVDTVVRIAEDDGLKADILPIAGPFHSPRMFAVVPVWRREVESLVFREGAGTFVSSIDAQVHTDPLEIRELLVRALLLPVRWREAVRTARDHGALRLWDAGPGTTLHKLGRRDKTVQFAPLDAVS